MPRYSFINQDFSKNGEDVLTYLHGLPDQSWPEPDEEDSLSVIDQVKFAILSATKIVLNFQVELAMAYGCRVSYESELQLFFLPNPGPCTVLFINIFLDALASLKTMFKIN